MKYSEDAEYNQRLEEECYTVMLVSYVSFINSPRKKSRINYSEPVTSIADEVQFDFVVVTKRGQLVSRIKIRIVI